jgi:nucleoside 2-deoxyribosyltransferase
MVKVYVAARFKGEENKAKIEELCSVVKAAGLQEFCFIRDVENYQKTFDDPKELWERAYQEISTCDAFLIDVSDSPSGGRVVELGIAFALKKPIAVLVKEGVSYKGFYDGVAKKVVTYQNLQDITQDLRKALS